MHQSERRDILNQMKDDGSKKRKRESNDKSKRPKYDDDVKKLKEEMEKLQNKIDELERTEEKKKFALKFDPKEYLKKGFIESAIWIKNSLAVNMQEKMKSHEPKWSTLILKQSSEIGTPCVTFNRGEQCLLGIWHTAPKKTHITNRLGRRIGSNEHTSSRIGLQSAREELRIHCCSLCHKALGLAANHSVLDCPWIIEKNWIERKQANE